MPLQFVNRHRFGRYNSASLDWRLLTVRVTSSGRRTCYLPLSSNAVSSLYCYFPYDSAPFMLDPSAERTSRSMIERCERNKKAKKNELLLGIRPGSNR